MPKWERGSRLLWAIWVKSGYGGLERKGRSLVKKSQKYVADAPHRDNIVSVWKIFFVLPTLGPLYSELGGYIKNLFRPSLIGPLWENKVAKVEKIICSG